MTGHCCSCSFDLCYWKTQNFTYITATVIKKCPIQVFLPITPTFLGHFNVKPLHRNQSYLFFLSLRFDDRKLNTLNPPFYKIEIRNFYTNFHSKRLKYSTRTADSRIKLLTHLSKTHQKSRKQIYAKLRRNKLM